MCCDSGHKAGKEEGEEEEQEFVCIKSRRQEDKRREEETSEEKKREAKRRKEKRREGSSRVDGERGGELTGTQRKAARRLQALNCLHTRSICCSA